MIEPEQRVRCAVRRAEDHAQQAVCPIYGVDDRDRPQLIGTSVPFAIGRRNLLFTAAHVLDHNNETTLYVPGRSQFVELKGPADRVAVPSGGRGADKLDLGFVVIDKDIRAELSRLRFLSPEDIDVDDVALPHSIYAFVGFPETKNKARLGRRFEPASICFTNPPSSLRKYERLGLDPASHILMDFSRRKLFDEETKRRVRGPMPHGMSGGGVWRIALAGELALGFVPSEKLVGIAIEYRQSFSVLIGVRISLMIEALRSRYSDIGAQLPQPRRLRINVTRV